VQLHKLAISSLAVVVRSAINVVRDVINEGRAKRGQV
jgi:hypothetical protein